MNRLARWLEETGTTQEALAAAIDVSRGYVSRLVSGERSPGRRVALAIEKVSASAVPASSWDEGELDLSPPRSLRPRPA